MDENTPLLQSQAHKLARNPLLIIFPALSLIQFISCLDQTANSTSLNAVAAGVHAGDSISLIGASFLITSTSIQLINRRLSDIFGRKFCLTIALSILGIGNLLSGFSTGPTELFLSRAFTGFGAGAINALVQIAIADITTLEQRGYYFGMIGAAVALGNGLGPSIGGYLTQLAGWQWSFWLICPLIPCAIIYLLLVWPMAPVTSATWYDLKLVDRFGALTSLGSISLFTVRPDHFTHLNDAKRFLQIAISQGGSGIAWISPVMAALLCGGSVLACVFALVEWKYANLPMLPARLFKYGCSTNILISTNLAIGWIYWGNLFILPLYFQTIRGMGAGESGLWILPITISYGLTSATTGIIISMCKCYKPVILTGAICWTVAALVKLRYSDQTSARTIFLMGILDGVGVGCSMQPGRPTYLGHSPQILSFFLLR